MKQLKDYIIEKLHISQYKSQSKNRFYKEFIYMTINKEDKDDYKIEPNLYDEPIKIKFEDYLDRKYFNDENEIKEFFINHAKKNNYIIITREDEDKENDCVFGVYLRYDQIYTEGDYFNLKECMFNCDENKDKFLGVIHDVYGYISDIQKMPDNRLIYAISKKELENTKESLLKRYKK